MPHAATEENARAQREPGLRLVDWRQENLGFGQKGIEIINRPYPIRSTAPSEDGSRLEVRGHRYEPVSVAAQSIDKD